jgi:hypothetical protein
LIHKGFFWSQLGSGGKLCSLPRPPF